MIETKQKPVVVIGAGIAGLTACLRLLEKNVPVTLVSDQNLGQNLMADCQLSFNASPDDVQKHVEVTQNYSDLVSAGSIESLSKMAPDLLIVLQRLGVNFDLSEEGHLKPGRLSVSNHSLAFSGNNLGRQITWALIDQIKHRDWSNLQHLHHHSFLSVIKNSENQTCGITVQDLHSMDIFPVSSSTVIMATGNYDGLFDLDLRNNNGFAIGQLFKQGAYLANPEFYGNGGLWADSNGHSSIDGVFAAGDCTHLYKGAQELPGNELVARLYSGFITADEALNHYLVTDIKDNQLCEEEAVEEQNTDQNEMFDLSGPENIYSIHESLVSYMKEFKYKSKSELDCHQALEKIDDLIERFQRITISDKSIWCNQEIVKARGLDNLLIIARVIIEACSLRKESRGVHQRSDFVETSDTFFKTTKVLYNQGELKFYYEEIDQIQNKETRESA